MLVTYFVLVILIFLLEFAAGTLGFVYRRHIGQSLMEEMKVGIQLKYNPDNYKWPGWRFMGPHSTTKFQSLWSAQLPGLAPDLSMAGARVGRPSRAAWTSLVNGTRPSR
uniref:Putative tetraspanin family n=1 Tax=Ixodes ricinus TaxID=34613 RepID=V5H8N7_IXORI